MTAGDPAVRIRFVSHTDDRTLGTAELVDGRLVTDEPSVQAVIDGKGLSLDLSGPQAAEFFASWSNGYIGSALVAGPDDDGVGRAALSSRPTSTVGIDLAAAPPGTAVVAIDWSGTKGRARLVVDSASGRDDSDAILTALAADDRVGIDCPFGWPTGFVDAVAAHRAGGGWPTGPDVDDRRELRLRATDRHVADRYGVQPLSVSTDKMGSVAMRWAALLTRHERVPGSTDRTGGGRLLEVYPALALRVWELAATAPQVVDYKKENDTGVAARAVLLDVVEGRVSQLTVGDDVRRAAGHRRHGHDVVDALLAALVAAAAATPGCVREVPAHDSSLGRQARSEGWIAIPTASSLSELAPVRGPWFTPR